MKKKIMALLSPGTIFEHKNDIFITVCVDLEPAAQRELFNVFLNAIDCCQQRHVDFFIGTKNKHNKKIVTNIAKEFELNENFTIINGTNEKNASKQKR